MNENLWNEFENFWDKSEIKIKAEEYQYLYDHPENVKNFSWINKKDKLNEKSKAIHWGIPNHVLGDIGKAKVIVGLLNPGTHMKSQASEKCDTVGKYIKEEVKIEQNSSMKVHFDSKEAYQGDLNDKEKLHTFYYDHILSKENVISKELKTLYKMYKADRKNLEYYLENNDASKKDNNESKKVSTYRDFSLVAYYLAKYYSKVFSGSESKYKIAIKHYLSIFDKINKAKSLGYQSEKEFEKALYDIKISNIEFIPYRSFDSNSLKKIENLESSNLSAKILIKKILDDKETIVILRSIDKWETLFKSICDKEGINFKKDVAPSIYVFKGQSSAISENNIAPYKSGNNGNINSIEKVICEIHDIIRLKDFEAYLDDIIAKYSK